MVLFTMQVKIIRTSDIRTRLAVPFHPRYFCDISVMLNIPIAVVVHSYKQPQHSLPFFTLNPSRKVNKKGTGESNSVGYGITIKSEVSGFKPH